MSVRNLDKLIALAGDKGVPIIIWRQDDSEGDPYYLIESDTGRPPATSEAEMIGIGDTIELAARAAIHTLRGWPDP